MAGMISNAIQQALRGSGVAGGTPPPATTQSSAASSNNTSTTTTTSSAGGQQQQQPNVQVQVGPTVSMPLNMGHSMGPPGVGSLNSFDPFLQCSSRHTTPPPAAGQHARPGVQVRQRVVRSAPGSRASSLPRNNRPRDIIQVSLAE